MRLVVSSDSKSSFSVRLDGVSIQFEDIGASRSVSIEKDGDEFSVDVMSLDECIESIVDSPVESVDDTVVEDSIDIGEIISVVDLEEALFGELAGLRMEISKELSIPPYMVFSNKTLKEMAKERPLDLEALSHISGIGDVKLEKFGDRFLEAIVLFICDEGESS